MKRIPSIMTFAGLLVAALALSWQTAQANDITLSENYFERVKKFSEEGDSYFDVVFGGKFSTRMVVRRLPGEPKLPLQREPVEFDVSIGNFSYSGELPARLKSQSFRIPGGRVTISRTKRGFVVTANGKLTEEAGLAASEYTGNEEVDTYKLKPKEDVLECSMTIGEFTRSGEIGLRGTAKTRKVFRGSGDEREEFYLTDVNLRGQGKLQAEDSFDDGF